jgi:predicted alpha/beta-fold hydrolase
VAAISSPLDLTASGHAIDQGLNRHIYTRMFLQTMKPRALQKWAQYPGLFDRDALMASQTLYAFDNVFTAPLHGFENTDDYWQRASAKPGLSNIRIPALALNACNDPFVPAWSLPSPDEVSDWVTLWQPDTGGHVGFPDGRFPAHVHAMPQAVMDWLQMQVH